MEKKQSKEDIEKLKAVKQKKVDGEKLIKK